MQPLDNKMDKLLGGLNYQRTLKTVTSNSFTESWLNNDNINIQHSWLVVQCTGRIEQRHLERQGAAV
jgi:hypothetical protein